MDETRILKHIAKPKIQIREPWHRRYKIRELLLAGFIGSSLGIIGYLNRDYITGSVKNAYNSVVKYFDLLEKEKEMVKKKENELEKMCSLMNELKKNEEKALADKKKYFDLGKEYYESNKKNYDLANRNYEWVTYYSKSLEKEKQNVKTKEDESVKLNNILVKERKKEEDNLTYAVKYYESGRKYYELARNKEIELEKMQLALAESEKRDMEILSSAKIYNESGRRYYESQSSEPTSYAQMDESYPSGGKVSSRINLIRPYITNNFDETSQEKRSRDIKEYKKAVWEDVKRAHRSGNYELEKLYKNSYDHAEENIR